MVHFGLLGASSASGPPVSGDAAVSGHFFRGQSSGHGSVSERADQSGDAGNGSRPADASESRPRPAAVSRERRSLALQSVGERHFRQFADAGPTGTGFRPAPRSGSSFRHGTTRTGPLWQRSEPTTMTVIDGDADGLLRGVDPPERQWPCVRGDQHQRVDDRGQPRIAGAPGAHRRDDLRALGQPCGAVRDLRPVAAAVFRRPTEDLP